MTRLAFALALVGACYRKDAVTDAGDYPADGTVVSSYPDDSPEAAASPCGKACKNLAALGCEEGGKACYQACVRQAKVEKIPVGCWTSAASQAAVRACGKLRCLPPDAAAGVK